MLVTRASRGPGFQYVLPPAYLRTDGACALIGRPWSLCCCVARWQVKLQEEQQQLLAVVACGESCASWAVGPKPCPSLAEAAGVAEQQQQLHLAAEPMR